MTHYRPCLQLLDDSTGTARCAQPWGTEHTHHDLTVEQAVIAGLAVVVDRDYALDAEPAA